MKIIDGSFWKTQLSPSHSLWAPDGRGLAVPGRSRACRQSAFIERLLNAEHCTRSGRTAPSGTKLGHAHSGWTDGGQGLRLRGFPTLTQPRPPCPVPAASLAVPTAAGKTNWAPSARSPSPAGRPSLCPSPGSVFIINISLFRSLGLS